VLSRELPAHEVRATVTVLDGFHGNPNHICDDVLHLAYGPSMCTTERKIIELADREATHLRIVVSADLVHDLLPKRALDLQHSKVLPVGAAEETVGAAPKEVVDGIPQQPRIEVPSSGLCTELGNDLVFQRSTVLHR
jgi:hypothetical protein